MDNRLRLIAALDARFIAHPQVDLLRQRIFGLALGYEDLNDHATLRRDPLWQTLERDSDLASSPTFAVWKTG